MRRILRNQSSLLQALAKNRYAFAHQPHQPALDTLSQQTLNDQQLYEDEPQAETDVTPVDIEQRNQDNDDGPFFKHEQFIAESQLVDQFENEYEQFQNHPYRIQGEWELAARHLFVPEFDLLASQKGQQIAKRQLNSYSESLNLEMVKDLYPKLYDEPTFYRRVAKYHLSEMEPLTSSFINQGYNFLNKKVLVHLIQNQKIKMLKQLLTLGAFETANYIDDDVLTSVIFEYQRDKRSMFLLNLLPFEAELVAGTKPPAMRYSLQEEVKFGIQEPLFTLILYESHSSTEINKLRLLWSYQRYYLYKFSFSEFIIPEMKKMLFKVEDPKLQTLINKQINFALSAAFHEEALVNFYSKMMAHTKTYENFVKGWALAVILFSKLRSIPRVVNDTYSNQLHPIFQLIEFNLPKDVSEKLIQSTFFEILLHEDSNKIWMENYQRCLEHWLEDFTQPQGTKYNSTLSKLVENEESSLTVIFQHQEKVEPYARTVIKLNKTREGKNVKKAKTQANMIADLLKGDYQSVFEHFMMRYSLSSDFDMAAKFRKRLSKVDKQLRFNNKEEEGLYKLKIANDFFFTEGVSKPLSKQGLEMYKGNLTVASLIDRGLFDGKQLDDYENPAKIQKELKKINRYAVNRLLDGIGLEGQEETEGNRVEELAQKMELQANEKDNEDSSDDGLFSKGNLSSKDYKMEVLGVEIEEPFREMVSEVINELEANNIIDKKAFVNLHKLPLFKSRQKIEEVFNKYSDYIHDKIAKDFAASDDVTPLEEFENVIEAKKLQLGEDFDESDLLEQAEALIAVHQPFQELPEYESQIELEQMLEAETKALITEQEQKSLKRKPFFGKNQALQENLDEDDGLIQADDRELGKEEPGDTEYAELKKLFLQPSMRLIQHQFAVEEEQQTEIDGAREDRAIKFAYNLEVLYENTLEQVKQSERQHIQQENEGQQQSSIEKKPEEIELQKQLDLQYQILDNLPTFNDAERIIFDFYEEEMKNIYLRLPVEDEEFSQDISEDSQFSEDEPGHSRRRQNRRYPNRKEISAEDAPSGRPPKKSNFSRNNKYTFCTAKPQNTNEGSKELAAEQLFDLEKIELYRTKEVTQDFLEIMKNESHIPKVGSGIAIAKYLFLHGKAEGKRMVTNPQKKLSIEFSSVVGTRTKNYEVFLKNTLYNYELEDSFYEQLLEDQMSKYNRYEFKQVVAHMIYFKNSFTDRMVELICNICDKHQTGYTFVQIAQFINANSIVVSVEALEKMTLTWHRFRLINEDMLGFVRDYLKNINIPFKTSFYSHFCRSLIKTNDFEKLKDLCSAVLVEIKPKTFKVDNTMKAADVPALEKAWKVQQQQQYVRLYLELIEVIVTNLSTKVPDYLFELFSEYRKLIPTLGEKDLAFGLVCYSLNKPEYLSLLTELERNPKFGTQFMYDCLMQSLLSNFEALEEYSERMLDATVFINRLVLNNERITRALLVFKKSSTSNAFSKFLEHCLRFQPEVTTNAEIKKEMFYILNNNVEDVSVGGVFNLLDFIFNEKREEERIQYRQIKLSEEEKERKLAEIQEAKSIQKLPPKAQKGRKKSEEAKPSEEQVQATTANAGQVQTKQRLSKKEIKQQKKQKLKESAKSKDMLDQMISQSQSRAPEESKETESAGMSDDDIINVVKNQGARHLSAKRAGVKAFGLMYRASIEMMKAEEEASKEAEKKAGKGGRKK